MSVSLIVIRIEVDNKSEILKHIEYEASNCQIASKALLTSEVRPLFQEDFTDQDILDSHIGNRDFLDLRIETFSPSDDETDDETDDEEPPMNALEEALEEAYSDWKKEDGAEGTTPQPAADDVKSTKRKKKKKSKGASVEVAGADVAASADVTAASEVDGAQAQSTSPSALQSCPTEKILFTSGNPMVDVSKGILHLYKQNERTFEPRSEMICMMAVPATMGCRDLMRFLAPVSETIEFIRIVRDPTPNEYMSLIKFKSETFAEQFYKYYNNTNFNSLEDNVVHLAYVAKVEMKKSYQAASLPIAGCTELPSCYICLERMDEPVDPVLTILCNHSFHGRCLAQWEDTSCPVCRYVQTPEVVADNKCFECGSQEDLWICLICGHVGCGRYIGGHANGHYKQTNHCYSMQLGNQRVWDYAGDNYVHRLVQNKTDGKLVQIDEGGNPVEHDEKLDSITLEYTYLLTSQLESQRLYFEEKVNEIEKDAKQQVAKAEERIQAQIDLCLRLEEKLDTLSKERHTQDKKCGQLASKLAKIQSELQEEKEMNTSLRKNQHEWQEKLRTFEVTMQQQLTEKDQRIADLNEQVRDLMFFIEAERTVSNATDAEREEIQQGQIVVDQAPQGGEGATGGAAGNGASGGTGSRGKGSRRRKR